MNTKSETSQRRPGAKGFETETFARRRAKNRKRNQMAAASRKKNR